MALIYLDTNIYIDYFDGRVDRLRPLGEFAYQILRRTFECEFTIVTSSLVIDELAYNGYLEKFKALLAELQSKQKLVRVNILPSDGERAKRITNERGTSFNDTLHAVVAQRMHVDYFVTRNLKDFQELLDLVEVTLPENL